MGFPTIESLDIMRDHMVLTDATRQALHLLQRPNKSWHEPEIMEAHAMAEQIVAIVKGLTK